MRTVCRSLSCSATPSPLPPQTPRPQRIKPLANVLVLEVGRRDAQEARHTATVPTCRAGLTADSERAPFSGKQLEGGFSFQYSVRQLSGVASDSVDEKALFLRVRVRVRRCKSAASTKSGPQPLRRGAFPDFRRRRGQRDGEPHAKWPSSRGPPWQLTPRASLPPRRALLQGTKLTGPARLRRQRLDWTT